VPGSGGVHAERTTILAAERKADDPAAERPNTLPVSFRPSVLYKARSGLG
jgi:hypothetical protein